MQEIVVGTERVPVGRLIGKGGEGQVFALNGRSGAAVKIYDPRWRVQREEKVRAMVHGGFAARAEFVAYPREVVSNRCGEFLGFVMRLVSGYRPIHELYSPKSRQRHFPKADYRFIVRAALNVARAVGKVHETGCLIGDLNHSGILVSQDARGRANRRRQLPVPTWTEDISLRRGCSRFLAAGASWCESRHYRAIGRA